MASRPVLEIVSVRRIRALAGAFRADESGATAVEYGVIASTIVIALIGALGAYGDALSERWNWLATSVLSYLRS